MEKDQILKKLRDLRDKDPKFSDGRIISSVSTQPLDFALEAFNIFSDTNALDVNIFPEVQKLEREVIEWFGTALKNPEIDGYITTGGTEANIAALFVAKKMNPLKKEILVPESAHYSIKRAAELMDLEIKWVKLDENFRADITDLGSKIDNNTLAVVATAGTSSLGVVDPVEEINSLCEDIFFHVDAAFGGFVLPFMKNAPCIDFSLENIDSITIDPHKMGMNLIPAGSILFRDNSYLEKIKISPAYLSFSTSTISGSRSGGTIASVWATINYLGFEGYARVVKECMENTKLLCNEIEKIDDVELVRKPDINVVGIRIKNMESVSTELIKRGWDILLDSKSGSIRVVVMPHVTEAVIKNFVKDLKEIITEST